MPGACGYQQGGHLGNNPTAHGDVLVLPHSTHQELAYLPGESSGCLLASASEEGFQLLLQGLSLLLERRDLLVFLLNQCLQLRKALDLLSQNEQGVILGKKATATAGSLGQAESSPHPAPDHWRVAAPGPGEVALLS